MSAVGVGLKTISLRLGQMKDIEGELVPKYQELVQQITNGRVSLVDSNGELKNTYTIVKELGGVWDTLNRNQQTYLLNELAGKNQSNLLRM